MAPKPVYRSYGYRSCPMVFLGNPAAEYIHWWIMRETQVLASVDLLAEVFIAEVLTSISSPALFLRRKSGGKRA